MGIFKRKKEKVAEPSSEFSRFFREAPSSERKKTIREAAEKARDDQRKVFYSKKTT